MHKYIDFEVKYVIKYQCIRPIFTLRGYIYKWKFNSMYTFVLQTTNVLCFLWYELAKHPDKQHKLQEEIATLNDNSGITKETLLNMPYLKACVKEIMRLDIKYYVKHFSI